MVKPILYASELSPAVRGVLLVAKAMDFELEIRYDLHFQLKFKYHVIENIIDLYCHKYSPVNLLAGEHLKPEFLKV